MATDYFLKIDGIEGESTDETHAKAIDVTSWSWSETQPVTTRGGGRSQSKADVQEFVFSKDLDKASINLAKKCAGGNHIKSAELIARKAGGDAQEYYRIIMSDLIISSYSVSGADDFPMEQCSIRFGKIEWKYAPQKDDGTLDAVVEGSYDVAKGVVA